MAVSNSEKRVPLLSTELASLDLRSVRLLLAMVETCSLSQAAQEMGMTPSSASKLLQHLRDVFHDPLFIRSGGRMLPTERLLQALPKLERLIEILAELTEHPEPFSPARAKGRITIGAADNAAITVFLPLLPRLLREAPGLSFSVEAIETMMPDQLRSGELDFAVLMDNDANYGSAFHTLPLPTCRHVLLVRKGHPLVEVAKERPLTSEDAAKYRRVTFSRNNPSGGHYRPVLERVKVSSDYALLIPQMLAAGIAVEETDLLLTCPLASAMILGRNGRLVMLDDPEADSVLWEPRLIWHERTHRSPLHVWLRSLLINAAREGALFADKRREAS